MRRTTGSSATAWARPIAEQPSLLSTIWLADAATNTYGGVCVWRDCAAMDRFSRSDAFHALTGHPNLTHVTLAGFAVLDGPTQITGGVMLPPRAAAPL